jgi:hypothetical protein
MGGFQLIWDGLRAVADAVTSVSGAAVAAWILGVVLASSGVTKLLEPRLAAMAIVDFGVARHVRTGFGVALGAGELLLGTLVVASILGGSATVAAAAGAASGVFWIFVVLLARVLRRGADFPCRCFGGEGSVSTRTLARAAFLALLATGLTVASASSHWVTDAHAALISGTVGAAIVMVAALTATIPRLRRWNADPFDVAQRRYQRRVAA